MQKYRISGPPDFVQWKEEHQTIQTFIEHIYKLDKQDFGYLIDVIWNIVFSYLDYYQPFKISIHWYHITQEGFNKEIPLYNIWDEKLFKGALSSFCGLEEGEEFILSESSGINRKSTKAKGYHEFPMPCYAMHIITNSFKPNTRLIFTVHLDDKRKIEYNKYIIWDGKYNCSFTSIRNVAEYIIKEKYTEDIIWYIDENNIRINLMSTFLITQHSIMAI